VDENVVSLASKQATPKKDPLTDAEYGVTTPMPGGSFQTFWGSNGEIFNEALVPIDDLVAMRRKDGQARALNRLLTLPVRAALKDAEWVEPDEGGAEQETEFANLMFKTPPNLGGMSTPLSKVVRNTMLAVSDGHAAFEEVRTVPDDGPLKGKIVLKKLAYRDSRTIRFLVDDEGGFNGIRQIANVNGKAIDVIIPKDKVWYYAANEEENPYYGVSYFESAYQHYDIKRKLYYIAHLAAQFAAVPARVGEVPQNPDINELRQFKAGLENFAFNTAMTAPFGYKVNLQNSTGQFDYLKLIDHHNHMMSRSVLAGFIDSEDRPALVDIAKTDPQADMFMMGIDAIMNEIAESWTYHLMPNYIDWNFGTKKYPVFQFGKIADDQKASIKEAFTTVVTSSVLNCTPEFVREVEMKLAEQLGLDIDYDKIQKMEEEAQKQAQEQADMQAEAQAEAAAQLPPGVPPGTDPATVRTPPPLKPKPFGVVAASRQSEIDELVSFAQGLLGRHIDEDLNSREPVSY
jgi:hypothetical protein